MLHCRSRRIGVLGFFPLAEVQANLGPLLPLLDPGEHMEELELASLLSCRYISNIRTICQRETKKNMSAEDEPKTWRRPKWGYLTLDVGAALRASSDLLDDPVPFCCKPPG